MNRRAVWQVLLGALCLGCFGLARGLALKLETMPEYRTLALEGVELSGRQAAEMLETESQQDSPMSFAVWGQEDSQWVQEPLLDRSAQVNAVLICGKTGLVLEAGTELAADDTGGCLIDTGTAQTLFGSSMPVGSVVRWGGRKLTVRGVLEGGRPVLAVRPLDDSRLGYVSLALPEGKLPVIAVSEFQTRHALFGAWSDSGVWAGSASFMSLLPGLLALGYVFLKIVKTAFAALQYPVVFLVCLLAAGAVLMAVVLAAGIRVSVPPEMLPSKWSDFGFWGKLFAEERETLANVIAQAKTEPELARMFPALAASFAGLAGSVLAAPAIAMIRPKSSRELWCCCAVSLGVSFGVSLLMGGGLARDFALWLMPLMYFGFRRVSELLTGWASKIIG